MLREKGVEKWIEARNSSKLRKGRSFPNVPEKRAYEGYGLKSERKFNLKKI